MLVSILFGCGSASKDEGADAASAVELVRVDEDAAMYSYDASVPAGSRQTWFRPTYSTESTGDWIWALAQVPGATPPAACNGGNTKLAAGQDPGCFWPISVISKPGEVISFRACAFNKTGNVYSPGITKTFTTGPLTK